jgi:hypothetical protein
VLRCQNARSIALISNRLHLSASRARKHDRPFRVEAKRESERLLILNMTLFLLPEPRSLTHRDSLTDDSVKERVVRFQGDSHAEILLGNLGRSPIPVGTDE